MSTDLRWNLIQRVRSTLLQSPGLDERALGERTGLLLPGSDGSLITAVLRYLQDAGDVTRSPAGWALARGAHTTAFPLATLNEVRRQLSAAWAPPRRGRRGWSKSPIDPAEALQHVPSLRLRAGWTLVAYLHRDGGNGSGVVWAMPAGLPHPNPDGLPTVDVGALAAPKPPGAVDDLVQALELDGTPLSHVLAWLVRKEARAFGAMGAGIEWSAHELVDRWPWDMGLTGYVTPSPEARWSWDDKPDPATLAPQVQMHAPGSATVTVHSWTALTQERLMRHVTAQQPDGTLRLARHERLGSGPATLLI